MRGMIKIAAICNQKRGGKDPSGGQPGFESECPDEKCTLLVDMDVQALHTANLGCQHLNQIEKTLTTVMSHVIMDKPLILGRASSTTRKALTSFPAGIELPGLEVTLVNTMSRIAILRKYLPSWPY